MRRYFLRWDRIALFGGGAVLLTWQVPFNGLSLVGLILMAISAVLVYRDNKEV